IRRPKPDCAVEIVDQSGISQPCCRLGNSAVPVEGGLEEVTVEPDPEGNQIAILLGTESLHRKGAHAVEALGVAQIEPSAPFPTGEIPRDLQDDRPPRSFLGQVHALTKVLAIAGQNTLCETINLSARIVVIELPEDMPAGPAQEGGNAIPTSG